MEPSNFSVSFAMIVLGFSVGFSVSNVLSSIHLERLHQALQKGIDTMFEYDKKNNEMKEELELLKKEYSLLQESSERFVNSYLSFRLPSPDKHIERCVTRCSSDTDSDFEIPETPSALPEHKD